MKEIEKKYIIDDKNKRIAVQLDITTFEKIEDILEDYGLLKLMEENNSDDYLSFEDAKKFYEGLDKAN